MNGGANNKNKHGRAVKLLTAIACACLPLAAYAGLKMDSQLSFAPQAGAQRSAHATGDASLPPSAAAPLSLAALTDMALRNNPATREVWQAASAQAAALDIAGADYWPTLDANIALTRGKTSINSSGGITTGSTQTRLSPGISLAYVLFDFGARAANKQAASHELLAANLNRDRALQQIVLDVAQAYYRLLGARQSIVAGEQTLKNAQLAFAAANARRRAGLATVGDVYQADTLLAQSRLILRKARGEANKLKGALCNAAGLPVTTQLELAQPEAHPSAREVRRSIDEYLQQAKQSRPDLASAEALARAARANAAVADAQGKPTLSLSASAAKTYNNVQSDGMDNASSSGSIGLNLNVPLFDGARRANTVKQAEARAAQLEAGRERLAQQIELEVWQAYYDLDTAQAASESAQVLLRSAGLAREVAQARYMAGVGNMPELVQAQADEAAARMEVIQAEMGWYASLSQLDYAIGIYSAETDSK